MQVAFFFLEGTSPFFPLVGEPEHYLPFMFSLLDGESGHHFAEISQLVVRKTGNGVSEAGEERGQVTCLEFAELDG